MFKSGFEPIIQMIFNAEHESGIQKCWNLVKMMEYENFQKIKFFKFLKIDPQVPQGQYGSLRARVPKANRSPSANGSPGPKGPP